VEGRSPKATTESQAALGLAYEQLCASHAALTDFRAKLLALLPIASGAGVFLLLEQSPGPAALRAVAVFGFAVTLGLAIYEWIGIDTCVKLRERGELLEKELGVPEKMGQFQQDPKRPLRGPLSVEGASWVVYLSVLLGWAYVAGDAGDWWGGLRWLILLAAGGLILTAKFRSALWNGLKRALSRLRSLRQEPDQGADTVRQGRT
jgi:hypothetical protein